MAEKRTRIVVSLDPPSTASSSGDSLSWEAVLAADAALGPMPGVSFSSIYAGQLHLKRNLDRMFDHVNNMQLQIDALNVEVSHLKRRRI
jgi:hypothetical protein